MVFMIIIKLLVVKGDEQGIFKCFCPTCRAFCTML